MVSSRRGQRATEARQTGHPAYGSGGEEVAEEGASLPEPLEGAGGVVGGGAVTDVHDAVRQARRKLRGALECVDRHIQRPDRQTAAVVQAVRLLWEVANRGIPEVPSGGELSGGESPGVPQLTSGQARALDVELVTDYLRRKRMAEQYGSQAGSQPEPEHGRLDAEPVDAEPEPDPER